MPALSQPTGAEIFSILVSAAGDAGPFIGDLTASDLDADAIKQGDRSILVREYNRQRALYNPAGLDPDNLTNEQLADGQTALYWIIYAEYYANDWMKKKVLDPDKCEPRTIMMEKRMDVRQIVCDAYRRLGIVDSLWCKTNWEVKSTTNSYCFDPNLNNFGRRF